MTKIVPKAIMRSSGLENKYYRDILPETGRAYKKQKNYTKRLIKKEKRNLISGNINELLFATVGEELIWESSEEKLLGVTIDKNLNFNSHLSILCKKAGQKVTALARIAKLLPFHKRRIILKSFIESQFSHCPLVWMFCSRQMIEK